MGEEYARDPGLQFYWLEKVLEKAKAKKQTVSVKKLFLNRIYNYILYYEIKKNAIEII
jgi:hypothetical protein